MTNKFSQVGEKIAGKYRARIRERAITQAKARIALAGKQFEDFSPEELEVIVADEEQKVRSNMAKTGLVALLVAVGLA